MPASKEIYRRQVSVTLRCPQCQMPLKARFSVEAAAATLVECGTRDSMSDNKTPLSVEQAEKEAILSALRTANNLVEAARVLKIGRTTLYRRLKDWGIVVQLGVPNPGSTRPLTQDHAFVP